MIRIYRYGAHRHRCPLAYPALAPLFAGQVQEVGHPALADLYLCTHILDAQAAPYDLVADWRVRRRPLVILSEEPFWDTIWGRRPLDRHRMVDTAYGALPVVQLLHGTCDVFGDTSDGGGIPYYLLTNHRFANAYAARFRRNAQVPASEWPARFAAYAADLVFMFERRPEAIHDMAWPQAGIHGLCAWRTELAAACDWPGVERRGASWQGGADRFALDNWHLDKLARLDGHARMIGAFENTHQPAYLTEKLFDAFACGGLPLYWARDGHRIGALDLPEGSWENLSGLTPQEGAAHLQRLARGGLSPERARAYAGAQAQLAALFGDPAQWIAARDRLAGALIRALEQVQEEASEPPPRVIAVG